MASIFVTWNGLRLDVPGFCEARNIDDLIGRTGPARGGDWTSDGIDGDTFLPKSRGSMSAGASFLVYGFKNQLGVARPDRWSGLRDNIELIEATVKAATEVAPQTLTVTYPDAAIRSALAWCAAIDVTEHDGDRLGIAKRLVLDIRIPSGRLT